MYSINSKVANRNFNKLFIGAIGLVTVFATSSLLAVFASVGSIEASGDPVVNTDSGDFFNSIQDAIDDPATLDGHTITIANGTYNEDVDVDKDLTFEGQSQTGVIIDTSSSSGYGFADNNAGVDVTVRNLTIQNANHYGLKLSGGSAYIENVTVKNSDRTEFDFNGMSSVVLKNIRALGENTSGNGVSFTNSDNITLENVRTRDNNWGGVALYPYGTDYPVGIDGVDITGLNTNEPNPLYIQVGSGGTPVENFNAPQFKFTVTNDEHRGNGSEFTFYQRNLGQATTFALGLQSVPSPFTNVDSVITRINNGWKFVPVGLKIANAVEDIDGSGVVRLLNGSHEADDAQIVIDKDIQLIGQSKENSVIKAQHNTASSGDGRGLFRVTDGNSFDARNFTLDGDGHIVWVGMHFQNADGDLRQIKFRDVKTQTSGAPYNGIAIRADAGSDVDVRNSDFETIGRIGVLYAGAGTTGMFANNVYTGKGSVDGIDYALDISAGANIDVRNNYVSNNMGTASSDGSGSAAFIVTTYFGSGTTADFRNNTIVNNTMGISVGYTSADTSTVLARNNTIQGNTYGMINWGLNLIDARNNFWGHNTGPNDPWDDGSVPALNEAGEGDYVYGSVRYASWNTISIDAPVLLFPANNSVINATTPVANDWQDIVDAVNYTYQSYNVDGDGDCNTSDIRWTEDYVSSQTNTRAIADGLTFCWRVKATTAYGESDWSDLWKVTIDNTNPAAQITNPIDGDVLSGTVTITGEIIEENPSHYYLVIKDTSGSIVGGPAQVNQPDVVDYEWDTTTLADGEYTVFLSTRDKAGNKDGDSTSDGVSVDSVAITVDNTPPVVSDAILNAQNVSNANIRNQNCEAITQFYLVNGEISLQTVVEDSLGNVNSVRYKVRKVNANGCTQSSIFSSGWFALISTGGDNWTTTGASFDTTSISDGEYTILLESTDNLGNKTVNYIDLLVDNTAPSVSFAGLATTDNTPPLTGTVDDDTATVEVEVDGETYLADVSTGTWNIVDNTLSGLTVGLYDVTITATDPAGNSQTDTFTDSLEIEPAVLGATTSSNDKIPESNTQTGGNVVVSQAGGIGGGNGFNIAQNSTGTNNGEDDEVEEEDEGEVLQGTTEAEEEQPASVDEEDEEEDASNFLADNWWWLLLLLVLLGVAAYALFGGNDEDNDSDSKS